MKIKIVRGLPFSGIEQEFDGAYSKKEVKSLKEAAKNGFFNTGKQEWTFIVFNDNKYESKLKRDAKTLGIPVQSRYYSKRPKLAEALEMFQKWDKDYPYPLNLKELIDCYRQNKILITNRLGWVDANPRVCLIDFEGTMVKPKQRPYKSKDLMLETQTILDGLKAMNRYIKIEILVNASEDRMAEIKKFLNDNCVEYDGLYMKPSQITEVDFKRETARKIANDNNILFAIDDDTRVCDMYRYEFNFVVYQMGDPLITIEEEIS